MKLKQISIAIENSCGRLYDITKKMGDAGINLRALNLVDTGAFGQLRIITTDVVKARQILMEEHLPARIDDVVAAEIEDTPGSMANVLKPLLDNEIKVIYSYAFIGLSSDKAVMIFRFDDTDKAIRILLDHGVNLLSAKSFGIKEGK